MKMSFFEGSVRDLRNKVQDVLDCNSKGYFYAYVEGYRIDQGVLSGEIATITIKIITDKTNIN